MMGDYAYARMEDRYLDPDIEVYSDYADDGWYERECYLEEMYDDMYEQYRDDRLF